MLLTSARRAYRSAILAGVTIAALLAGCGTGPTEIPLVGGDTDVSGPKSSTSLPPVFYVDPTSPAAEQVTRWRNEGRTADAAQLEKISDQPTAKWLTGDEILVRDEVDEFVGRATIAGQTPVLVADNIPDRDCGRFGAAGAPDAATYRSWIRQFATGIDRRPAIVIFEPGAVADAVDGCVKNEAERFALLKDAIAVLKSTGSTRVYLDAGHPSWVKDVPKLVTTLNRAGIADADGFALNVANFIPTAENVTYGHRISNALGGDTPFVIDTSRNGNGPYPTATVGGAPSWCNPPERALGEQPTDNPDLERVDALLWIKYPGESDGACRPDEPETGDWWPEYALDLAERAGAAG